MRNCILHPKGDFVIIHPDYLAIAQGNECAAEILQRLEFWTNPLLEKVDRWIRKRIDDFQAALFKRWSRTNICHALQLLDRIGLIRRRQNVESKALQTREYLLQIEKVQAAINKWHEASLVPEKVEPKPHQPLKPGTFQNKTLHSPEMDCDPLIRSLENTTCVYLEDQDFPENPEGAKDFSLPVQNALNAPKNSAIPSVRLESSPPLCAKILLVIEKIAAFMTAKHYEILQARVEQEGVETTLQVVQDVVSAFEEQEETIRKKAAWLADGFRTGYKPTPLVPEDEGPQPLAADDPFVLWYDEARRTALALAKREVSCGYYEIKTQEGFWQPWTDMALRHPLESLQTEEDGHFTMTFPTPQEGWGMAAKAALAFLKKSGDKSKDEAPPLPNPLTDPKTGKGLIPLYQQWEAIQREHGLIPPLPTESEGEGTDDEPRPSE